MKEVLRISYFEKNIKMLLSDFDIQYFSYESGSFGSHDKVVFAKNNIEGYIDFYEHDFVEIHIFDFDKEDVMIHILMDSDWDRFSKEEKIQDVIKQILKTDK